MNKKIFSISLFLGLFFASSVFATEGGLLIQFETETLFDNENFLPGDIEEGFVMVSNMTGEAKDIAVEAINWPGFPYPDDIPSDDLSRALEITIKAGDEVLYGPESLFDFYSKGETFLSTVSDESYIQYDFEISFPSGKGGEWQGMTTGFDILIGSRGTNGGETETFTSGSVGGGGGGLPRGLIIYEPVSITPELTSATIEWETSYESTSRVLWSQTPGSFDLSAGEPGYGYEYYTEEDTNKVTHHTVVLTGLNPGTTYYYRCISHGSLALSTEYSFTTLKEDSREENVYTPQNEIVAGYPLVNRGGESNNYEGSGVLAQGAGEEEDSSEEVPEDIDGQTQQESIFGSLLAAIGMSNYCLLLALLICVLIVLFFLCVKNGKIDRKKICWLLPLAAIALFVLYCLYCPYCWYLGIAIAAISLVVYIAMMLKA